MQLHDKQTLLADLESGRNVFLDSVSDVTEELAVRAPAPGRWSVLECVEHVAASEDYLFSQIMVSSAAETPLINLEREARIVAVARDRSKKIQSPDVGRPSGRFPTLAEAIQHFQVARERTLQFVQSCTEDLRCKITSHPMIRKVNCYEMLLMIAAHPFRHAEQIEEIKKELENRE